MTQHPRHEHGLHAIPLHTIFVASENVVETWSARAAASGDVMAFTDADAQGALEAIARRHPQVVVLEQLFAATSRGAAFVYRVQTDPALSGVEIRVLSPERTSALASSQASAPGVGISLAALAHPLELRSMIRRAARVKLPHGVDALVDGNQATVVDLSTIGAQVLSPTILRPNQRVRVFLPEEAGALRMNAGVAWAAFEMPRSSAPQYRAGIEFSDADPQLLEAFYTRLRTVPQNGHEGSKRWTPVTKASGPNISHDTETDGEGVRQRTGDQRGGPAQDDCGA